MFYTTDLHTLPEVSMMGRVTQKPGYTSVQNRIPENILILKSNQMPILIR